MADGSQKWPHGPKAGLESEPICDIAPNRALGGNAETTLSWCHGYPEFFFRREDRSWRRAYNVEGQWENREHALIGCAAPSRQPCKRPRPEQGSSRCAAKNAGRPMARDGSAGTYLELISCDS
ncbi:hypothetical protein Trco_005712 [Trichoderma cornu-damae]|uniref:Uncharacterized protein n=1 Tax=Trichoderma cornu-damae TaxID=654480 RepID=A0A9P8TVH0_9HYPO|nr:hypothetical protein Trco_005712 [Trichoderma cornu-damae]